MKRHVGEIVQILALERLLHGCSSESNYCHTQPYGSKLTISLTYHFLEPNHLHFWIQHIKLHKVTTFHF